MMILPIVCGALAASAAGGHGAGAAGAAPRGPMCASANIEHGARLHCGPPLRFVNSTSAAECCSACAVWAECATWAYGWPSSEGSCHMSGASPLRRFSDPKMTGGERNGSHPPPPPAPPVPPPGPPPVPVAGTKPHVIFLIADDVGYANLGWLRKQSGRPSPEVATPHMDGLVRSGVRLDRHYTYKVCSPTRSSFQSGRLPVHVNTANADPAVYNPADPVSGFAGIPRNMSCLANKLKLASYATHQIGKWDAGMATADHTPRGRGYDSSFGYFHHVSLSEIPVSESLKSSLSHCPAANHTGRRCRTMTTGPSGSGPRTTTRAPSSNALAQSSSTSGWLRSALRDAGLSGSTDPGRLALVMNARESRTAKDAGSPSA